MINNQVKSQGVQEVARQLVNAVCVENQILAATGFENIDRIDLVTEDMSKLIIQVRSDDFTLDHKISVERVLTTRISNEFEYDDVVIRFKRSDAAAAKSAPAKGPAPVSKRSNPFGLKIDKKPIPNVGHVIVVASGKGGVGKSTVSTNLAVALAQRGQKVGLLDGDIYGPSSPTMLGLRGSLGVLPTGKLKPLESHGVKCVSYGFMSDAYNPVLWRGPMVGKAINQFCYDVDWGELDVLVIDLPPGTGDVQLSLMETLPIHEAIVVTTPQDVALIDAHKAVTMFEKLSVPISGIIENMAAHVCTNCGHEDHVFGEHGLDQFAEDRSLAILGRIPLQADVRLSGDNGQPIALQSESTAGKVFGFLAESVICQIQLLH